MVEFASGFRKSGGCPSVDFAPTGAARGGDRVKLSRLGSFRATPTTRQICRVGGGDGEEAGLGRLGSIRVDWGRLCHLLHRSGGARARVGRRRPFFFSMGRERRGGRRAGRAPAAAYKDTQSEHTDSTRFA